MNHDFICDLVADSLINRFFGSVDPKRLSHLDTKWDFTQTAEVRPVLLRAKKPLAGLELEILSQEDNVGLSLLASNLYRVSGVLGDYD